MAISHKPYRYKSPGGPNPEVTEKTINRRYAGLCRCMTNEGLRAIISGTSDLRFTNIDAFLDYLHKKSFLKEGELNMSVETADYFDRIMSTGPGSFIEILAAMAQSILHHERD